jgi:UDP-glucose:(heptosyl)LPS alpha-1,3-glucosyltransferase
MNIALVQPKFDRSGGAERYGLETAAGLSQRGHAIHFFARRRVRPHFTAKCHRVLVLPLGRALKTWSFARSAAWEVRRCMTPLDIVYGLGKTYCQSVHRTGGGVHGAYLERRGRIRPTLNDRIILGIEKRLFTARGLQAVICPSAWVAREVARFHPQAASRLTIVPNGVDTQAFSPAGRTADRRRLHAKLSIPEHDHVILFVANNFYLKGLDHAIALLPSLPRAHLVVLGEDDPRLFDRQAWQCGVRQRVHFLGRSEQMAPLYRGAELLFHPTRYDPFANVCLEAMACGTPIVTSDRNGAGDLLGDTPLAGVIDLDQIRSVRTAAVIQDRLENQARWRRHSHNLALRHDQAGHWAKLESAFSAIIDNTKAVVKR